MQPHLIPDTPPQISPAPEAVLHRFRLRSLAGARPAHENRNVLLSKLWSRELPLHVGLTHQLIYRLRVVDSAQHRR
jgi:hypothetical protein